MRARHTVPAALRVSPTPPRVASKTALAAALAVALGTLLPAGADAGALGMAGAYSLKARTVEAPGFNPATLAWDDGFGFRIASTSAEVGNSSFSLGDYDRWNGKTWTRADKEAILERIPEDGLSGSFDVRADGPGMAWKGFAVTSRSLALGTTNVPRGFARLLLFGNNPEESFQLDGAGGDGVAWSEVVLSHGRQILSLDHSLWGTGGTRVAAGMNARILRGWGVAEVTQATGGLTTADTGLTGDANVVARTSEGGNGFGLDFGLAAETANLWRFGLSFRNLYSTINWTRQPKEHRERAYADAVTAQDLDRGQDLVTEESSTAEIDPFRTSLPFAATLAASRPFGPVELEADLVQGTSGRAGSSTTPRFAVGAAYAPWTWLEAHAGLSTGGFDRGMSAAGLVLRPGFLRIDFSVAGVGSVNPFDPKGAGAEFAIGVE